MTITRNSRSDGAVTLALSGMVSEDELRDLERSVREAARISTSIYIDMSEVTLLDRAAARWLSRRDLRIVCINCPGYISRWIES